MANVKISALPLGTPQGTDLIPGVDTLVGLDGVTKRYVQSDILNYYLSAQGLITYQAVTVGTTGALTVTYANGTLGVGATLTNAGAQAALVIDGKTLVVGARVLVKDQASTFQNGIYTVTNVGSVSTNWVMTRATDYDQASEIIQYGVVIINQGTVNAGKLYQETGAGPFTIGTTPIVFALYSAAASIGAVLLAPTGAQTIVTYGLTVPSLTTANLSIDVTANTIASTNTNGNIAIIPNGSGVNLFNTATAFGVADEAVQLFGVQSKNSFASSAYRNASASGGNYNSYKSRSTSVGVFVPLQSGDLIGAMNFFGDDGTTFVFAGGMSALVTGAVSTGIVPTTLSFQTQNLSGSNVTAMTISEAQVVSLSHSLLPDSGGTGTGTPPSAGQIPIGTSGNVYTPAAINSGTGIVVANGSGSITVSATGGGFATATISGTTQTAVVSTKYIALNAGQTTLTLPTTYAVGDVVALIGSAANTGGWVVQAASGDTIRVNNSTTSASGSVTCTAAAGQCIELVCDVANTSWVMTSTASVLLTTA